MNNDQIDKMLKSPYREELVQSDWFIAQRFIHDCKEFLNWDPTIPGWRVWTRGPLTPESPMGRTYRAESRGELHVWAEWVMGQLAVGQGDHLHGKAQNISQSGAHNLPPDLAILYLDRLARSLDQKTVDQILQWAKWELSGSL